MDVLYSLLSVYPSPTKDHLSDFQSLVIMNRVFLKDFIYLFMRDTHREREREREREAETQVEGEAGSMQGAQSGTGSWDPRITPQTEGRH